MSRRSRRHRKRFNCGHRGFGCYCHACIDRISTAQAVLFTSHKVTTSTNVRPATLPIVKDNCSSATKDSKRKLRREASIVDGVDLRQLPEAIVAKALQVLQALRNGTGYWQLGGKRLVQSRQAIRIPVTRRYRLLCFEMNDVVIPLQILSHEDYNPLIRHPKRLLSRLVSQGRGDR